MGMPIARRSGSAQSAIGFVHCAICSSTSTGSTSSVTHEDTKAAIGKTTSNKRLTLIALLRLSNVPSVSSYFASVEGSLDAFLTKLISGQRVVRSTTGDGSFLCYSAASRGLPFELEVWPAVGATAWFWATATNPGALLSASTDPESLPYLITPTGPSQSVNELDGASSVGRLNVQAIDPGGVLKG